MTSLFNSHPASHQNRKAQEMNAKKRLEVTLSQIANANGRLSREQIKRLIDAADIVFAVVADEGEEPASFLVKGEEKLRRIQRSGQDTGVQLSAFWCSDPERALALRQAFGDGRLIH
jgi:hypothetical protein